MLLRAAILPKDMVVQLVQQGLLPPGVLAIYGQEIPETVEEKEGWLQQFGLKLDDQEMEFIKETVLDDPGVPIEVGVYDTIEQALAADEPSERIALRDQFGRLCFDLVDGPVEEGQIVEQLGADPRVLVTIVEVESLYQDDEEKFLVCRTENMSDRR
jgi:hypothetical protein